MNKLRVLLFAQLISLLHSKGTEDLMADIAVPMDVKWNRTVLRDVYHKNLLLSLSNVEKTIPIFCLQND